MKCLAGSTLNNVFSIYSELLTSKNLSLLITNTVWGIIIDKLQKNICKSRVACSKGWHVLMAAFTTYPWSQNRGSLLLLIFDDVQGERPLLYFFTKKQQSRTGNPPMNRIRGGRVQKSGLVIRCPTPVPEVNFSVGSRFRRWSTPVSLVKFKCWR